MKTSGGGRYPLSRTEPVMDKKIKEELKKLSAKYGGTALFGASLPSRSTVGIGGSADVWYEPFCPEEFRDLKRFLTDLGKRAVLIGNASNILFPDGRLKAILVNLSSDVFKEINIDGATITTGAGASLGSVISASVNAGLSGLEGLVGIPGTVGGAIKMNAGYKSSVSDLVERVLVMDSTGSMEWRDKKDMVFGYRWSSLDDDEVILQAVFSLKNGDKKKLRERLKRDFKEKMTKQPLDKRSLGSIFKNPPGISRKSAELIDMAGLKGAREGAAVVSEKHANFIINEGGAYAEDYMRLVEKVRQGVFEKFGILMEMEIKVL